MEFRLRQWRMDDAESIAKFANNPNVAKNLRNVFPYPYRLKDAQKYVRSCLNCSPTRQLLYAIEIDGRAVGSAGLFRQEDIHCKTAEIGYWLGEPFWGQGVITQVIAELCMLGFEKYDIVRIEAWVFWKNTGSRIALEKNGFLCEGVLRDSVYKNDEFQDCCIYGLLRKIWEKKS